MTTPVGSQRLPGTPPLSAVMTAPAGLPVERRTADSAPLPGTPPTAMLADTDSPLASPAKPANPSELGRTKSTARRTLGNWQLGKTIGQGSMGRVRLGLNIVTGEQVCPGPSTALITQVAVKIIPRAPAEPGTSAASRRSETTARPKDENREIRAIREAAIVTLLRHPYICSMRDVIVTQGHFYLFFEYVDGGQMLDYIISHGKLREKHARKFARQILSALDYCHRNSIVHRGICPSFPI
jgi:serine/threonine protein kinase KIN1/2